MNWAALPLQAGYLSVDRRGTAVTRLLVTKNSAAGVRREQQQSNPHTPPP